MSTQLDLGWFNPNLGALQRRSSSGLSTGLSRAIAERLGLDVIFVRVVFIVLAFCAGLGLALYGWGTVLTRGPQGHRPIDQFLPSFGGWSSLAQKSLVVATTIAAVATVGSVFPLPWAAGVLVLIALAVLVRRILPASAHPAPQHPQPSPPHRPGSAALDDDTLVEHWRRTISEAVGSHRVHIPAAPLPEVDLYGPEQLHEPARPAGEQPKAGWLAGIGVTAAMGLTAFITGTVLGQGAAATLAATTAVGGLGAVTFALVARRRRIPRPVLVLLAGCVVASGWLASHTAELALVDPAHTYTVRVVAEEAVIDLRDVDLDGYSAVRIDALLANVEIIVPGPVAALNASTWAADFTDLTGGQEAGVEQLDVELTVIARLSDVTLMEQP